MHFLSASLGLTSGNKAFCGAFAALLLSGISPDAEVLPPPWLLTSLSLFLCLELLLPKQHMMEHKKLDRFFGGSGRKFRGMSDTQLQA